MRHAQPRSARLSAVAAIVVLAVVLAACGKGVSKGTPASTTTPGTGSKRVDVPGLGTGVTATQIKLGVALIDYKCIEGAVDSIYVNQEQAYNAFIDNINEKGGINGRKIVPVYKTICPVPVNLTLAACTSFTEDDHVFAVIGSMYDPAGDARLCVAKQHKTVLISDGVTQEMIDKAPPGLLLTPNITSDRQLKVIMALVKSRHILDGKTVGVLTETTATPRIKAVVKPTLDSIGVKQGSEAVLSISGLDTTSAQTQLDSFIERWKAEHVNALILVGAAASSKQFIGKVKAAIPDMELIADTTSVEAGGQDDVKAHIVPNPYDGIITAEGRIGLEHSKTPHYTYCKTIYEKQTGITIPLPNVVVKLPNGKQNNIYGNAEDACSFVTMFQTIATRVGKNLNNANWISTVDHFGPIEIMNTYYASLHAGKYDADDTYGLVQFDPKLPPIGEWRHLTPTENVSGA
jgi:ABC-type branched-subunit amino acid transport system substrate-binding protein